MTKDSVENLGRGPDSQTKSSSGGPKVSVMKVFLTVLSVWIFVFSIIWLAGPISNNFSSFLSAVSDRLNVYPSTVIIGAIFSTYLTVLILLSFRPENRDALRRVLRRFLKQERSFHLGSSSAALAFLGATVKGDTSEEWLRAKFSDVAARLEKVERGISQPAEVSVSENEWEAIRSKAVEFATERLAEDVRGGVRKSIALDRVLKLEAASLARLSDQIVVLGSRANLALGTGVVFCVVGLGILWWTLANVEFSIQDSATSGVYWAEFLKVFAPRLSLVLIVEVIGFFFLKLFRAALDEVRLTQNEITNVEMKLIAANLALSESRPDLPKVILELATTERNMIIEKGQTTVELERARGVREVEGRYVDSLVSLLKGRK